MQGDAAANCVLPGGWQLYVGWQTGGNNKIRRTQACPHVQPP